MSRSDPPNDPEAVPPILAGAGDDVLGAGPAIPLPAFSAAPPLLKHTSSTPLVLDERAITRLLDLLLSRSGLSRREAAKMLGQRDSSLRQYLAGRRMPGIMWFVRFAELCGARVVIEWPSLRRP